MPGKLSEDRQRVSFADDIQVIEQMRQIALSEGRTLTDLYAEATREFLKQKQQQPTPKKK